MLDQGLWHAIVRDERCAYCGRPAQQADHVRPVSRAGRDVPVNLVPLCERCNLVKSDYWPGCRYHPFEGYDDRNEADRIFEAEIAWLRDRYDEAEIMEELWWRYETVTQQ